jgi:hypothetical protein
LIDVVAGGVLVSASDTGSITAAAAGSGVRAVALNYVTRPTHAGVEDSTVHSAGDVTVKADTSIQVKSTVESGGDAGRERERLGHHPLARRAGLVERLRGRRGRLGGAQHARHRH